jgi:hypothetical protein
MVQVQGGQGGGAGEPAQAPLPAAQPQSSPLLSSAHSPLAGGFTYNTCLPWYIQLTQLPLDFFFFGGGGGEAKELWMVLDKSGKGARS